MIALNYLCINAELKIAETLAKKRFVYDSAHIKSNEYTMMNDDGSRRAIMKEIHKESWDAIVDIF